MYVLKLAIIEGWLYYIQEESTPVAHFFQNDIIAQKNTDVRVVAIVKAGAWFKTWVTDSIFPSPFVSDDLVVCRWSDFHDGLKSNIEGMQTIALFKNSSPEELEIAKKFWESIKP